MKKNNKNYAQLIILIVMVLVSYKAILFTWNLFFAARYFHEDKTRANGYMIRSLNYNPSVYRVYKKYKYSGIDYIVLKMAIYSKYLNNQDVFKSFGLKDLTLSQFKSSYKNNFYLKHLFDGYPEIKTYENLDHISQAVLADPSMNPLTISIFKEIRYKFSRIFLENLVDYCTWKENIPLKDYLTETMAVAESNNITEDIKPPTRKKSGEILDQILSEKHRLKGISPGKNLIESSFFENEEEINRYWTFSNMASYEPFSDGSFIMDYDEIKGNRNLRIMGFFVDNQEGKSNARGGAWYRYLIPVEKKYYLFSFDFMIKTGRESPTFWLSEGIPEQRLPHSNGKWQKVVFIFNNSKEQSANLKPLIRMWGTGSMWIDNIMLVNISDPNFSIPGTYVLYIEEI